MVQRCSALTSAHWQRSASTDTPPQASGPVLHHVLVQHTVTQHQSSGTIAPTGIIPESDPDAVRAFSADMLSDQSTAFDPESSDSLGRPKESGISCSFGSSIEGYRDHVHGNVSKLRSPLSV